MTSIYDPEHSRSEYPVDMECCRAGVTSDWFNRQCTRKGTITEDGVLWCKQHAPSAQAKQDELAALKFKINALRWGADYQKRVIASRAIALINGDKADALLMAELEAAVHAWEVTVAKVKALTDEQNPS
jgi:hypothetical protein